MQLCHWPLATKNIPAEESQALPLRHQMNAYRQSYRGNMKLDLRWIKSQMEAWSVRDGSGRHESRERGEKKGRRLQSCDIPQMFVGLGWPRSMNWASVKLMYTSSAQQQQVSLLLRRAPLPSLVISHMWMEQPTVVCLVSWISAICSSLFIWSGACKHVLTGHVLLQWQDVLALAEFLAQHK